MVSLECLEKDKKCIFVAERLCRPLFVLWTETILFLGDILKLRVFVGQLVEQIALKANGKLCYMLNVLGSSSDIKQRQNTLSPASTVPV